jgi:hypothetical protein
MMRREPIAADLQLSSYGLSDAQLQQPVGLDEPLLSGFMRRYVHAYAHAERSWQRVTMHERPHNPHARPSCAHVYVCSTGSLTLEQLHGRLVHVYSSSMGVESVHCQPEHMRWLEDRLETVEPLTLPATDQRRHLATLCRAHTFEACLAQKYVNVKRFGVEGAESVIVGLNALLETACERGVTDVVMGMCVLPPLPLPSQALARATTLTLTRATTRARALARATTLTLTLIRATTLTLTTSLTLIRATTLTLTGTTTLTLTP